MPLSDGFSIIDFYLCTYSANITVGFFLFANPTTIRYELFLEVW